MQAAHILLFRGKTYVLASLPADDADDLSLRAASLLLRKKVTTYPGLRIFGIETKQGDIVIQ